MPIYIRLIVVICSFLIVSCDAMAGEQAATNHAESTQQTELVAPVDSIHQAAAIASGENQGRVISSLSAGDYIYMEVDISGNSIWIAGTPLKVSAGDLISWDHPYKMEDFHSKGLDRTFKEILFVNNIAVRTPRETPGVVEVNPFNGKVLSVQNVASYTYLEIITPDDKIIWLAAPLTPAQPDAIVSWRGGTLMYDFVSSSLERTFPEILFVTKVRIEP